MSLNDRGRTGQYTSTDGKRSRLCFAPFGMRRFACPGSGTNQIVNIQKNCGIVNPWFTKFQLNFISILARRIVPEE